MIIFAMFCITLSCLLMTIFYKPSYFTYWIRVFFLGMTVTSLFVAIYGVESVYDDSVSGNVNITQNLTVTGNLSVNEDANFGADLNVTGNITGNLIYGEIWFHNHTGLIVNFAVKDTYYNLSFDKSLSNGFTNSTYNITANVIGRYKVCYMASGDGQNNHEYYTAVTINGINQTKVTSHKKMSAGGDIVTMTGCGLIDLNTGDAVGLATANIGNIGTGKYYSSNLNLIRIGDIT